TRHRCLANETPQRRRLIATSPNERHLASVLGQFPSSASRRHSNQISRFTTSSALSSMNLRRASTFSPISVVKISSAATASSSFTCNRVRVSAFIVVSQSCSAFISPSPLNRVMVQSFLASSTTSSSTSCARSFVILFPLLVMTNGGLLNSSICFASERSLLYSAVDARAQLIFWLCGGPNWISCKLCSSSKTI